jgi:hypothetical protein
MALVNAQCVATVVLMLTLRRPHLDLQPAVLQCPCQAAACLQLLLLLLLHTVFICVHAAAACRCPQLRLLLHVLLVQGWQQLRCGLAGGSQGLYQGHLLIAVPAGAQQQLAQV